MEEIRKENCLQMSPWNGNTHFMNLNCSSKAFFTSLLQFCKKLTCNDTSLPNLLINEL